MANAPNPWGFLNPWATGSALPATEGDQFPKPVFLSASLDQTPESSLSGCVHMREANCGVLLGALTRRDEQRGADVHVATKTTVDSLGILLPEQPFRAALSRGKGRGFGYTQQPTLGVGSLWKGTEHWARLLIGAPGNPRDRLCCVLWAGDIPAAGRTSTCLLNRGRGAHSILYMPGVLLPQQVTVEPTPEQWGNPWGGEGCGRWGQRRFTVSGTAKAVKRLAP